MTIELVFALIGGAGFLTGVAALLTFFNTRKPTRTKGSADAYKAYREFTTGAFDDRDREQARIMMQRDGAYRKVDLLIDLVQDLIKFVRSKGATPVECEHFQDRLDSTRQM